MAKQWTGPYNVPLPAHSSLRLIKIKSWIYHTQIKCATPQKDTDLAIIINTKNKSWTCTPKENLKFFF